MLAPGDTAPQVSLVDAQTGQSVEVAWSAAPTVVAFFKTTCPVCQMVAPKVTALAEGARRATESGARVIAIGQDPVPKLQAYAARYDQQLPTLSEPPPYEVSSAFGISAVPTLFLVGTDGIVNDAVGNWDRERWNALAASAGVAPVSDESDGLPVFRPG